MSEEHREIESYSAEPEEKAEQIARDAAREAEAAAQQASAEAEAGADAAREAAASVREDAAEAVQNAEKTARESVPQDIPEGAGITFASWESMTGHAPETDRLDRLMRMEEDVAAPAGQGAREAEGTTPKRAEQPAPQVIYGGNGGGYVPPRGPQIPPEPEKKRRNFWKIALGVIAAGIVIGLIAFGVNKMADTVFGGGSRTPGTTQEAVVTTEAPSESKDIIPTTAEASQTAPAESTQPAESIAPVETQKNAEAVFMDVSDIAESALPTVVAVTNTLEVTGTNAWGQKIEQQSTGAGSGVIIGQTEEELLIVTNAHVVDASSTNNYFYTITSTGLKVTFCDGSEVTAYLKGSDEEADLAVMAVKLADMSEQTRKNIAVARIGNSDELRVGNGVIAIGNALGFGQSLTVGYVSALNRDVTIDGVTRTLLQTDAAINPGNSGGALLNIRGELIGINSAKYSEESVEGIGYAIPITQALDIIENLKSMATRVEVPQEERGYLGIRGATVDSSAARTYGMPVGIYVSEILEGTPANESELRPRDIIVSVDGNKLKSMSDLQTLLKYYRGGTVVSVKVMRQGEKGYEEVTFDLTLASQSAMPND
ncbi:MAG: trypsin-like peptidase domain-containing protein [Lachnospiraceae bacterium]|nr:trypsin-like peptidase domain-containing protein [Lachnospiraceae bacterium]